MSYICDAQEEKEFILFGGGGEITERNLTKEIGRRQKISVDGVWGGGGGGRIYGKEFN